MVMTGVKCYSLELNICESFYKTGEIWQHYETQTKDELAPFIRLYHKSCTMLHFRNRSEQQKNKNTHRLIWHNMVNSRKHFLPSTGYLKWHQAVQNINTPTYNATYQVREL
jgi:hypothetical protein